MNHLRILAKSILALLPALALTATVRAASDTWTGAFDGDFTNTANWLGGNVPGLAGLGTGNTDVATFNNSANTTISLNGNRNLGALLWDNSAPGLGAFTLSGSTLSFSSGGVARLTENWGTAMQTVASAVLLNGTGTALTAFAEAGSGGITFTGPITTSNTVAGTSTIALRAGLGGGIGFTGGVNNNGAGLVSLNAAQSSTGTTTLGGVNGFTGGLLAHGGRLIIDDTAGASVLAAANFLRANNATVEFRGAASGASGETLGTLQVNEISSNRIAVSLNGGAGNTVQVAGLAVSGTGVTGLTLFDLPTSAVFKTAAPVTAGGTAAGVAIQNGLVMSSGGGGANSHRASYLVRDLGGIGFATQNASNELVRYTGATAITSGDGAIATSATTNYSLATSLTRSAAFSFSTLQVDTAAAAVTLDMGANTFNATAANGRAVLISGANNFSLTGTGSTGATTYLHNHSTGTVTLDILTTASGIISSGPGLTVLTKTPGADLFAVEGITRLTLAANYTNNVVRIYGGGVLELGADLNGATAGDFSRGLGTAAGQVSLAGSTGGFSAFGADRTVNLGGAAGTLAWSATDFIGGAFVLSSTKANATLIFANPLNLAGGDRVFDVRNGSATVDARLTGALTNATAGVKGGVYKTGAGTLEIAGATNSYDGGTRVAEGRVLVSGAITGTTAVMVQSGSTFELGASSRVADAARVKLEGGTLAFSNTAGGGLTETVGALTLSANSTIDFGTGTDGNTFNFAAGVTFPSGTLSIWNWSGTPDGTDSGSPAQDRLLFAGAGSGLDATQLGQISFFSGPGTGFLGTGSEISFGGGYEIVPIPEPSTLYLAGSLLGFASLRRLRQRRDANAAAPTSAHE